METVSASDARREFGEMILKTQKGLWYQQKRVTGGRNGLRICV